MTRTKSAIAAETKFYKERTEIIGLLLNTVESVPELTIPQILVTLMRRKGGDDPYYWSDSELKRRIQLFQEDVFENPLELEKDF
jgi:hypothetical protein